MQLYETINGEVKVRLLKDHQPNQAMLNEFQTATFDCKMRKLELCGRRLNGYEVEEPACFLKVYLTLRNVLQEPICIYKDDFQLSYDKKKFSFEAEDHFGVQEQLPDVMELDGDSVMEGCLVFLIPQGAGQLLFTYHEYADEEDPGKTYRLRYVLK